MPVNKGSQKEKVRYGKISRLNSGDRDAKVPFWKACRYQLAAVSFVYFIIMYMVRFNMSIAIVCMSAPPNITTSGHVNNTAAITNTTVVNPECAVTENEPNSTAGDRVIGTFHWSRALQGGIMSSFFYGYLVTQLPGGVLSRRFGTKIVLMVCLCVSFVCTVFVPLAANYKPDTVGPYLLILLRVLLGIANGVCFPAMYTMWGDWAPTFETTKLTTLSFTGAAVGIVITNPMAASLCANGFAGGWPSIFYVAAICNFVVIFLWWFLVYDSPSTHPWITDAERNYILQSIGDKADSKKRMSDIPWRSLFTSPCVLVLCFTHFTFAWCGYTISVCLPMYMHDVLKYSIKSNGLLSALPILVVTVVGYPVGFAADLMRRKTRFSTLAVRKLFQSFASICTAAIIVIPGHFDCDKRGVVVALICVVGAILTFARAGGMANYLDIAPKYAGVIFGMSNTLATCAGILAPTVVGILTPNGTREEWTTVFYIIAGISLLGGLLFFIFARGEKQEWAKDDAEKWKNGEAKELEI